MTVSEENFLTILEYCIHPQQSLPVLKEPADWSAIMDAAAKQNLFPLVYDAAAQFSSFGELEDEYFASATKTLTQQMEKTSAFLELYKAFLEDGFEPIVMKGIICRSLYGTNADLRPSGDEDVLIEKKDFDRAVRILNRCGYTTDETPDKNLAIVQEVTFKNPDTILEIELHLNPFGTSDYKRVQMNEWFHDVFGSRETVNINGVSVRTMEPTDHLLFLIFHAFKHFIGGGFGIRLMTDCLLFAEKYGGRIDWGYVWNALTKTGVNSFYTDLIILGNTYLGFDLPCDKKPTAKDELLEDMLRMGTFGNTTKKDRAAAQFTVDAVQRVKENGGHAADGGNASGGKIKGMTRRLFPSWKTWTSWKPYLADKPWFLPVEWCKRVGRYLRGETDNGNLSEISESYAVAEHRVELLSKYKVV